MSAMESVGSAKSPGADIGKRLLTPGRIDASHVIHKHCGLSPLGKSIIAIYPNFHGPRIGRSNMRLASSSLTNVS
jgi:hypothetical protein